ncbi:MAG: hypothetical protein LBM13_06645 [Candidatus Ancillula sp.]|jgi:hypothetical protein|nr:hypothetical protein [Candidatus Ancillula sp.]
MNIKKKPLCWLAICEGMKNNTPKYFTYSGGCSLTFGLRMFGLYHHGPFDWVMPIKDKNRRIDMKQFRKDLLEKNFSNTNKGDIRLPQKIWFPHEDIAFDSKEVNKIITRLDDVEKNKPIPVGIGIEENAILYKMLELDDPVAFKWYFIHVMKDQIEELR